jgi:hypothetical protein
LNAGRRPPHRNSEQVGGDHAVNEDRPMKLTIQQNARHGGTARLDRRGLARR